LKFDSSPSPGGDFRESIRFVIPKIELLTVHLDHDGPVLSNLNKTARFRRIFSVLCSP